MTYKIFLTPNSDFYSFSTPKIITAPVLSHANLVVPCANIHIIRRPDLILRTVSIRCVYVLVQSEEQFD
jgi:hypothetical protein